jgi:hypothetical protein
MVATGAKRKVVTSHMPPPSLWVHVLKRRRVQAEILFNHLIGAPNEWQGHFYSQCLGCFEVYDHLDFGSLHHGQTSRLLSIQNFASISTHQAKVFIVIAAVTDQATGRGEGAVLVIVGTAWRSESAPRCSP